MFNGVFRPPRPRIQSRFPKPGVAGRILTRAQISIFPCNHPGTLSRAKSSAELGFDVLDERNKAWTYHHLRGSGPHHVTYIRRQLRVYTTGACRARSDLLVVGSQANSVIHDEGRTGSPLSNQTRAT